MSSFYMILGSELFLKHIKKYIISIFFQVLHGNTLRLQTIMLGKEPSESRKKYPHGRIIAFSLSTLGLSKKKKVYTPNIFPLGPLGRSKEEISAM